MKQQDIVEMLINMSWLKEMERKKKDMFTGVFHIENEKRHKAYRGMTTLFVLYWKINMCYADMGPKGGHWRADN